MRIKDMIDELKKFEEDYFVQCMTKNGNYRDIKVISIRLNKSGTANIIRIDLEGKCA